MAREQWASKAGFILATIGSAIGVGNIWRFPHLVGANGGGTFLLAYMLCVLAFAMPLLILELATGRRYTLNFLGALSRIGARYRWVALGVLLLAGALLSYYLVIVGWGLGFLARSAAGRPLDFDAFSGGSEALWGFAAALLIILLVVGRGVKGGIESVSLALMPILLALIVVLVIYSLTLPGRAAGLVFYLKPDFSALGNATTWVNALGQTFFSVGIGMGVMVTYGSYVTRQTDLHASALWIVLADTGSAFLIGLAIFPMVFTFGLAPAAGPELAFVTLPHAFAQLPLGQAWAAMFFLLFVVAGVSSGVSLLETLVSPLTDGWGWGRWRATLTVSAAVFLAGIPSALSYTGVDLRVAGERVFDVMDLLVGTFGLQLGALASSLVMAWAASKVETIAEINLASRWPIGSLVIGLTRYAVPAGLAVVLAAAVYRQFI